VIFIQQDLRRAVRLALLAASAGAAGIFAPAAMAQQAQTNAAQEEEVVVTGSRIRRPNLEGPSPVVTIDAAEMEARGYSTVLDALEDLPQNSGGGFDQQNTFGFTPSASAVNLRGFGEGRALVLIDGRRLPVFPLAANGTDNFVDLSSIPVAAIERIEVVTDGASAVYGSDAVSGVINVILKKTTEDELTARVSDTFDGGGAQKRLQFATGFEGKDGSNALVFLEYFEQDRMMFTDRDYSRSDRLGGINGAGPGSFSSYGSPGNFFANDPPYDVMASPDCDTSNGSPGVVDGLCRFNRAQYRMLLPDMKRFSITTKWDKPITESVTLLARATYFTSNNFSQIEPVPADTGTVPAANPNNPMGVDGTFARRMVEFGPRTEDVDNDVFNVVAALQGSVGRFDWEFGTQYAEQRITGISSGYMRDAGLDQAVTTGLFDTNGDGTPDPINLFERIPQEVIDAIRAEPRTDGLSTIASADFRINGALFDLPAGTVQSAFIAEYAKERFEDRRDPDVLAGNVEGLGGTSGGGERKRSAVGLEFEFPILSNLDLNVAGRYDNYDDDSAVGGAFSPRLALTYRPLDTVMLRTTAGKSFRAPDMQRLFGAETTGFEDLIDTPTCVARGGQRGTPLPGVPAAAHDPCVDQVTSVETRTGANRELEEEKGENFSFGVVWQPLDGLSLTADFWYVKLEQIVNTPETQFVLDSNAADGSFADAIRRDPVGCDVGFNPGCIDVVSAQSRNLSFQRARGVDTQVEYRLRTAASGTFRFKVGNSYLDRLEIREFASEPTVDVLSQGDVDEMPRFRGTAGVNWESPSQLWTAAVFVNHIGAFTPSDTTTVDEVDAYTTVNVSGSYELPWNARLHGGVNNIFNEEPPEDFQAGPAAQPFYNQDFHDPFGATWWMSYSQRF
jgi:iron complex outermembrane recepter protein